MRNRLISHPQRAEIILLLGLLFLFRTGSAQYVQFSQYNFAAQRINPALLGTTPYLSFDVLSRSQKTGGDFSINTNFASVAYPLINASTGRAWSGVGLSVMDDRSAGIFSTQHVALNYAVNVRLDRYHLLSFGMKGLYQTQSLNLNGFVTGSQYVPDRGFTQASNESFSNLRKSYATFSTGLYWQQTDRNGKITAYWGASLFDFNKPNNSLLGGSGSLPSSFVFHGGIELYREKNWALFPELLYTGNASNHLFNIGARTIFDLTGGNTKQADHLDLITKYVPGRSGIVGLQLHRENFAFGVSYDFPVFVTNAGNLGALEIGLSIKKLVKRKIKGKSSTPDKKPTTTKNGMVRRPRLKPIVKPDTIKTDTVKIPAQPEIVVQKVEPEKPEEAKGNASVGKISSEPLLVEKITLRFHFDFNSIDLDDETEEFLENLSTTMKEDPQLRMKITGHTDNIGHEKFNQRLSVKRAQAIKDFLVKKNIDAGRIDIEGKGMSEPTTTNETEEGRAKNRRVEISVSRIQ